MSNFSEVVAGLSLITLSVGFIIAVIIIGPLLTIWALNVIFPVLAIGYSFKTWLAILLLGGFIRGRINNKKESK